jgi:D-sedoheptulose 7-phosphate isomerase
MAQAIPRQPEHQEAIKVFREHVHRSSAAAIQFATESAGTIADMSEALLATLRSDGKVMFCGNGGSAALGQHLSTELVGRYLRERRALPAIALTTDTSALTAIANDYGFEEIFRRQVEALAKPGDTLVALSASGDSADVVLAAQTAKSMLVTVLAFVGQPGGELAKHADLTLYAPSVDTPIIQEMHLIAGHALCDLIERALIAAPETFGVGPRA